MTARTVPQGVHAALEASPWVVRWSPLVPVGARVLDVACGAGRHVRWFHQRGCQVTALDRDSQALAALSADLGNLDDLGDLANPTNISDRLEVVCADIEQRPWPLNGRHFDAVLVTNYLWRPLLDTLVASVAPGGVLIYETFSVGQATVGRPSNPEFLLRPGELLAAVNGLRVLAFEDGFVDQPPRFVQRVVAVREAADSLGPVRYSL